MLSLCLHTVVRLRPDLLSLPFVKAFLIVQIHHIICLAVPYLQANYSEMYYFVFFRV